MFHFSSNINVDYPKGARKAVAEMPRKRRSFLSYFLGTVFSIFLLVILISAFCSERRTSYWYGGLLVVFKPLIAMIFASVLGIILAKILPHKQTATVLQLQENVEQDEKTKQNAYLFNGIIWCWHGLEPQPETLSVYCKCGYELKHVANAESWQADFKCPNCGKSYISITKQEPNAKPRSLAKTKHIISAVIREKLR